MCSLPLLFCFKFSSVQSCLTLCDPMNRSTPGLPVHHQLPESTQTHVHWVGDAIQPSHPVIPFSFWLQSFPASGSFPVSQFFTSGGQKCWSFSFSICLPIQDWFPLGLTDLGRLRVQGTLKSLLQHHSSNASVLPCSDFFMVQISH